MGETGTKVNKRRETERGQTKEVGRGRKGREGIGVERKREEVKGGEGRGDGDKK